MFADQNPALRRASSGVGRGFSVWTVSGAADAYSAAKDGWLAAGWFSFGYMFGGAMIASNVMGIGRINAGAIAIVATVYGFFMLAGAVLAGFLFFRQARWAAVVLTAWAALEIIFKLLAVLYAGFFILPGLVINLIVFLIALRSARGAFALASQRKAQLTPAMVEETFR